MLECFINKVKLIHYFICITIIVVITFNNSVFPQKLVVGYYPDWVKYTLPYQKIQFQNLTHIIHAFAWPTSTGEISLYSGMLDANLNKAVHNAGKKILLCLGGAGQSDGFAPVAADSLLRSKFIRNVIQLIKNNNYDGIDLDWETPADNIQRNNLTILVDELRKSLDEVNPALLLTMAVSASDYYGKYFNYEKMVNNINWFSMMGYDFHGSWSSHAAHNAPLYAQSDANDGSDDQGIKYLNITRKIPKEKLLLGVPFYGKEFNSSGLYKPFTGSVIDLLYSDIFTMSSGWEYYWDNTAKVPYLLNSDHSKFITFDDTTSIRFKCNYVNENNLNGVMIWALSQDLVGNSQPLLQTIGTNMGLSNATDVLVSDINTINDYKLFNYPNPFNPVTIITYQIPVQTDAGIVSLKVYNLLGQEVKVLVYEELKPGKYQIKFNASNLSSGVYYYSLVCGNSRITKKMIYLK